MLTAPVLLALAVGIVIGAVVMLVVLFAWGFSAMDPHQ